MSALQRVDVTGILERAGADAEAPEGSQAWALAQVDAAVVELIEAAKPMATAAHDRGLMADILKGMRAHEAEGMRACTLRLDAALANIGPQA